MATLRELKKRLQSVKTTGKLAGAMRTASTAKYSRASSLYAGNAAYADALASVAEGLTGEADAEALAETKPLYVLIAGNRGLCGGYNHELFAYFNDILAKEQSAPAVIACGRMAIEYCRERGIAAGEVSLSDVPTLEEAEALAERISEACSGGDVSAVAVHQGFINMLKHVPRTTYLLPAEAEGDKDGDEMIYVPDEDTVRGELLKLYITQNVYALLLQCACGAQAATLMAMRSAYDNAEAQARSLETEINRRRQAEVTQSVLETSADTGGY